MQTIYYTTPNFIRHTSSIVDLGEYRRKLALSQEGSLAPQPQLEESLYEEEDCWEPPVLVELHPRRSRRADRRALVLDVCASLGVLAMTLTFTLKVLLG